MADPTALTHAYLDAHPADAARVLEAMAADDAAALFERLPARLGAPVLEAMRPYAAARALPPEASRAALLLGAMSIPATAALLRYLPEARRRALIDALPTATALACRALLGYPEDSVGAHLATDVVALPRDARVRDAVEALRGSRVRRSGPVYVVDAERRPQGQVELWALLQAEAESRIDTLMHDLPGTLPAIMPVRSAQGHPIWRRADVVPVVERGGALVGVIERRALARAGRDAGAGADIRAGSIAGLVGAGYWRAVSALIDASVAIAGAPTRDRT